VSDILVLRDVATYETFGAVYSKEASNRLNLSIRGVNRHYSKLESLGWIERLGNRRCPFQCYRLPRETKIPVTRILQHFIGLIRQLPGRVYFPIWYATRPCSYGQSMFSRLNGHMVRPVQKLVVPGRMPGRPGGASVPFGVHLPVLRREGAVPMAFYVPFTDLDEELFLDVLDDFERNEAFDSDFDVSVEWSLGDGFGDDTLSGVS
jgi:hypothetical protein